MNKNMHSKGNKKENNENTTEVKERMPAEPLPQPKDYDEIEY
ncbi:hypothetical protein [Bacillus sp. FJAT-49736]|nr:hypothetical protein [Bacillus sp. FJAT-49736]